MRTIEEVLGLPPMNLNDALATPMTDIFNTVPNREWTFTAAPASILYCTNLPLPSPRQPCNNPGLDARYWARVTKGLDFNDADRIDGSVFNRILWKGFMGDKPYPAAPGPESIYARTARSFWPITNDPSNWKRPAKQRESRTKIETIFTTDFAAP